MNKAVIKCKLFHQSWWGPYAYSELYDHETMQCDKCGIIYDEVDECGNTSYGTLTWYEWLVFIVTLAGITALLW